MEWLLRLVQRLRLQHSVLTGWSSNANARRETSTAFSNQNGYGPTLPQLLIIKLFLANNNNTHNSVRLAISVRPFSRFFFLLLLLFTLTLEALPQSSIAMISATNSTSLSSLSSMATKVTGGGIPRAARRAIN